MPGLDRLAPHAVEAGVARDLTCDVPRAFIREDRPTGERSDVSGRDPPAWATMLSPRGKVAAFGVDRDPHQHPNRAPVGGTIRASDRPHRRPVPVTRLLLLPEAGPVIDLAPVLVDDDVVAHCEGREILVDRIRPCCSLARPRSLMTSTLAMRRCHESRWPPGWRGRLSEALTSRRASLSLTAVSRLLVLALGACVFASVADARVDGSPSGIDPWRGIDAISIGMSAIRVEYEYGVGRPRSINTGTASVGADASYRRGNGWLWVGYSNGRVDSVGTTSAAYRTPNGLGVGSKIPLGRCHRIPGGCKYTWQGFRYSTEPCCGWYRLFRVGSRSVRVWLFTLRGRVTAVWLSDTKYW